MTTIAYPYQIEGCSADFDAEINGYGFIVTIKLDKIEGINDVTQLFNSLTDSNVPLIGSDLSGVDSSLAGCWLRSIESAPLGDGQFRLTLHYQQSPFNTIRISSQTQTSQVESNKDKDGDPVTVVYLYPADYGGDEPTETELSKRETYSAEQGGTFSKLTPDTTRSYEVREAIDPRDLQDIVGTINDDSWFQAADPPTESDQYKWMLVSITGSTDNSQQSPTEWVNTYTFQYKVDRWKPEVVFTDGLNNDEPVPDPVFDYTAEGKPLSFGGSKVTVDAYEESDFTNLFPDFT